MNLPTMVEAIETMLWSTSSSRIEIAQVSFSDPRSTLIVGKEDLPIGLTPNREDHFVIYVLGMTDLNHFVNSEDNTKRINLGIVNT
jgi:hypothetical protein